MIPTAFLSFDVEALPGRAIADHVDRLIWGRFGGEEWGIKRICAILAQHQIKANFMIDMAMCHLYGDKVVKDIGEYLLAEGHEIHAHLHAEWTVRHWDVPGNFRHPAGINQMPHHLADSLLQYAAFKFRQIFAFAPYAFRSGGFHFNQYTISGAKKAGIRALTNYAHDRHAREQRIDGPAVSNEPFQWKNGIIEIPTDFSPEPLDHNWNIYRGYFDRVRDRKSHKTFNLVLHSWSLLKRENELFTRPEPAHEERLHTICHHLKSQTQLATYATYFKTQSLPPINDYECNAILVSAPQSERFCNICGALYYRQAETDICKGCSSRARHRQLHDLICHLGNPFTGKSVLANYANSVEKAAFLNTAESLHNFDIRPVGEVNFQMDIQNMQEIEDASFDVFFAMHVLNHVKDDVKALSEIHRVLKQGGFAFLSVPYRENESTSLLENKTEHYGNDNFEKYGVGSYRRYGFDDVVKLFARFFSVTVHSGHDPLTKQDMKMFFLEKKL